MSPMSAFWRPYCYNKSEITYPFIINIYLYIVFILSWFFHQLVFTKPMSIGQVARTLHIMTIKKKEKKKKCKWSIKWSSFCLYFSCALFMHSAYIYSIFIVFLYFGKASFVERNIFPSWNFKK